MEGITSEQLIAKYHANPVTMSVLDGLDAVNWSTLRHAHGEASDVPALLRAALSENEHDREFAFILLNETIWHQGTVYEASAYIVPFLLRLLESSETSDKTWAVVLLTNLADGHSYLEVHARDEKESVWWKNFLAKDGRELEVELAKEIGWVNVTREVVGKGLHLLYSYLEHVDASIREYTTKTLGLYPDRASETLPLLENALAHENDEFTIKAIQTAINKLK